MLYCFLIDTFLANEIKKGNIKSSSFHNKPKKIKIHGHCYQKALGSIVDTFNILNMPVDENTKKELINKLGFDIDVNIERNEDNPIQE